MINFALPFAAAYVWRALRIFWLGVPAIQWRTGIVMSACTVAFMTLVVPANLTLTYRFSTMVACFGFCLLVIMFGVRGVMTVVGALFLWALVITAFIYAEPLVSDRYSLQLDDTTGDVVLYGDFINYSEHPVVVEIHTRTFWTDDCLKREAASSGIPIPQVREYVVTGELLPRSEAYDGNHQILSWVVETGSVHCPTLDRVIAKTRTYHTDSRALFGMWFSRSSTTYASVQYILYEE